MTGIGHFRRCIFSVVHSDRVFFFFEIQYLYIYSFANIFQITFKELRIKTYIFKKTQIEMAGFSYKIFQAKYGFR